uniref:Uncharacterized protein n=1 Tax=Panagrolaimus superbus TaxID=310955 RepID=A0A914Y3A8_9BILA
MPPTLNQDILKNICKKLLKDEEYDAECLNKFALAGKESLEAFETVIASAKAVYINGENFVLKMIDNDKTYFNNKLSKIATERLLKLIGSCTKRVSFTGVTEATAPIIDAICSARQLIKLAYFDDVLVASNEIPFGRILQECHASLRKIVTPAEFYFSNNPQIFHLQTLYFKSDSDNIWPYLNHPSCVAEELIIEIKDQEGASSFRWNELHSALATFNNPALTNLKHLKFKIHFEEYTDSALLLLFQLVQNRFPSLQTFTLINQLSLNEYCHTFQDFIDQSKYYLPIYNDLIEESFNFSIEIEWNVLYNVVEKLFKPHYTDICRRIYNDFDCEIVGKNTLILSKNDELSPSKSVSFEVKVVNGDE